MMLLAASAPGAKGYLVVLVLGRTFHQDLGTVEFFALYSACQHNLFGLFKISGFGPIKHHFLFIATFVLYIKGKIVGVF